MSTDDRNPDSCVDIILSGVITGTPFEQCDGCIHCGRCQVEENMRTMYKQDQAGELNPPLGIPKCVAVPKGGLNISILKSAISETPDMFDVLLHINGKFYEVKQTIEEPADGVPHFILDAGEEVDGC